MGLARIAWVLGLVTSAIVAAGACGANVVVDGDASTTSATSSSSGAHGGSSANGGAIATGGSTGIGGDTSVGGSSLTFATVTAASVVSSTSGVTSSSSASSSSSSSGSCLVKAPATHRPAPGTCTPSTTLQVMCQNDSQCVAGDGLGGILMGTCTPSGLCDFDQCEADTDCPGPTSICQCHGTQNANLCVDEGCRDDTDCATGYCSPSRMGTCMMPSWDCHTCSDTCIDDIDCARTEQACVFSPMLGYFTCTTVTVCAG